jgi:CRP/FNR family transcriptional regulator, cyclic AMP receptor protein
MTHRDAGDPMNPEELKHIAVLQAMDSDALARLAAALEEKGYAEGETVFTEGDPGDSMYFIAQGCVRIEKRAQAAGAARKTLTVLEAGDYFGEMALLDQKPRSASAVATGDARILRLSRTAFDQMQARSGAAGMSVLFAMIRTSGERIRRLSTQLVVYDEVGKAIGESRDLQTLLNVILQQLSTAAGADWALLLLRSQFSDRLEIRAEMNLTLNPTQREAVAGAQGFLGPVLKNPQDQLVADFGEQEIFKSCARLGFESASLVLSPIILESQLLGLIVLGGDERDHFDLNALHLTRGIARQAGQAILNARHREEEQARSRHSRQFVRF